MFAVVQIAGKQYAVTPDSQIDVDHIEGKEGDTLTFTDVLLRDTGKNVTVGTPFVSGAKITATIQKQYQGEKIEIRRFKAKARYRRKKGFRAQLTQLHISSIA